MSCTDVDFFCRLIADLSVNPVDFACLIDFLRSIIRKARYGMTANSSRSFEKAGFSRCASGPPSRVGRRVEYLHRVLGQEKLCQRWIKPVHVIIQASDRPGDGCRRFSLKLSLVTRRRLVLTVEPKDSLISFIYYYIFFISLKK